MMNKERIPPEILPSIDTMPELNDESIADVLTWLMAFVDALRITMQNHSHDGDRHAMKNCINKTMTSS